LLPNIGLVTIKNLYAETVSKGVPLFDILSDSNNKTIIKYVQTINEVRDNMDFDDPESIFQSLLQLGHKLGLSDNISKTIKDDSDKNSVMQQLVDLSENFKLLDHLRPRQYSLAEFFLENYSSVLPISSVNESVKLSTVHSAKGLEFPVVFLPDFKPHGNRPMWDPYASFTLTEEDKRVLYVGMTRAKTLLYMQMDSVDIDPRKNTRMVFSPDLVNYHPPTLDKTLLDTFRNNRVKQFEGHGLPFGLARNFYRSFHSMSRFIKR
jgi:superfamily I DNA/RNA helicase